MSQEASHRAQPGPALRDEAGTQGSERGWELFPAQCGRQPSQLLAPRHGLPHAPGACYGQQTRGLHNDPKAPGRVTSAPTPSKPEKRVCGHPSPQRCPRVCSYEGGKRGRHFRCHLSALSLCISARGPSVVRNGRKHEDQSGAGGRGPRHCHAAAG